MSAAQVVIAPGARHPDPRCWAPRPVRAAREQSKNSARVARRPRSRAPQSELPAPPLHGATAWLVLPMGTVRLALTGGCAMPLGYLWWSGPLPLQSDGRRAAGSDSYALGPSQG